MRKATVWSKRLLITVSACGLLWLGLSVLAGLDGAATQTQQNPQPPAEPLDLNTATVEQLQKLPGVGPKTAAAIVRFREKSGPFRRVEDLLAIRGITQKKLEKIAPLVTVKPVGEAGQPAPRNPAVRN
ncbi:MAG: helix-hairpin-helix domain-containing protein [Firmicutes bacterium]|jgi:competence protein ComEA|nr:helix-hairpin-helix domain-containing protein [Bacillota bacterium]